MKRSVPCVMNREKKVIFANNIEETAQKIKEILPFSKIALLTFSKDFLEYGKQLNDELKKHGNNLIKIIIDDNFSAETEKFTPFLSLPEDVRGVIAFNKKLTPLICSNFLKDKTAFFIERDNDACGINQQYYHLKDCNNLRKMQRKEHLYIIMQTDSFNLDNYIKCACLYTNMLVDYVFRQNHYAKDIDIKFVNKVKALLIDAIFVLEEKDELLQNKLTESLINIEKLLAVYGCYYSCSATISSFITKGDFFELDYSFRASQLIMKRYEQALKAPIDIKDIDYNESAKTLAFITELDQNYILSTLYTQMVAISANGLDEIKEQVKKLILLYKKFAKNLKQDFAIKDKFYMHNLLLSIDLSGLTPFGINGMTFF